MRERRKLKKLAQKIVDKALPREYLNTSFRSWCAHAARGDANNEIRAMAALYDELEEGIEMSIMIELEQRMVAATARAEAAAIKCEKLAALLELKVAENELETDALERMDAQDAAICELAEIISEV